MKATHTIKVNGRFYFSGEEIPTFDVANETNTKIKASNEAMTSNEVEVNETSDEVEISSAPKGKGRPPKAGGEIGSTETTEAENS